MKTQEILTIIGLSCLGLCLLLCLLKMSMKDKNGQANCDKSCGMLFFVAAVLIGVSQLLKETSEPYGSTLNCKNGDGGKGAPCTASPGQRADSSKCQNMGKPPGCQPSVMSYAGACYTPDANGCAVSGGGGGGGGGGSACGPPPGIPAPGVPYAPLFAGNNQLCSDAIKKLPTGWSTDCENSNFIQLTTLGKPKPCSKNKPCVGNFMCNSKGYCESTGDGSYHNVTCTDTSGVNIKSGPAGFGFCHSQVPGGSTGRCGISKNTSLR